MTSPPEVFPASKKEVHFFDNYFNKGKDWYYNHFSYKARGIYVKQLQRWLDFFSKKQLLILKSEELYDKPQLIIDRVLNFLELSTWKLEEYNSY